MASSPAPALNPVPLVPPPAAPPGRRHLTSTDENGSFCTARCACGWSGPARRSRDRARRDASEHAPR